MARPQSAAAPPAVLPAGDRHADGLAARARKRSQAVHQLVAAGANIRQICRELDLSRGTVRRFARATTVDELRPGQRHSNEVSVLEPFAEHLRQRWNQGITNATALLKRFGPLATPAAPPSCASTSDHGEPTRLRHEPPGPRH
jgi:transposase-like protein